MKRQTEKRKEDKRRAEMAVESVYSALDELAVPDMTAAIHANANTSKITLPLRQRGAIIVTISYRRVRGTRIDQSNIHRRPG
jgi:hypothetical protein